MTTPRTIDWPTAYFTACADNEQFANLTISSLKKELATTAYAEAANLFEQLDLDLEDHAVEFIEKARELVNTGAVMLSEHVRVCPKGMLACVNEDDATSEASVFKALDLVAAALEQLDGEHGTIHFGERVSYSAKELAM